jgi:hypothetical protein
MYMVLSSRQHDNIKKDMKSFENVAKFKYSGMILTQQTACTKKQVQINLLKTKRICIIYSVRTAL